MKTLISIPLIILILFSGISVKIATHYCGGHVAATKVSLSGELATCGMERPADNNSLQDRYTKNCCKDVLSAYSICNNYIATSFNVDNPEFQVINTITVSSGFIINPETIIKTSNNDIRPPGTDLPNSVDRPVLCIFRI